MRFTSPISLIPTLALLLLSTKVAKVTALPSPLLDVIDDPVLFPAVGSLDLPIPKGLRLTRRTLAPRQSPKAAGRVSRRVRRTTMDFTQPANVPMPLVKPREVDSQQGEKDEALENQKKCGEDNMHDCYVSHEVQRVRERRAEAGELLDSLLGKVPVAGDLLNKNGARRLIRRR